MGASLEEIHSSQRILQFLDGKPSCLLPCSRMLFSEFRPMELGLYGSKAGSMFWNLGKNSFLHALRRSFGPWQSFNSPCGSLVLWLWIFQPLDQRIMIRSSNTTTIEDFCSKIKTLVFWYRTGRRPNFLGHVRFYMKLTSSLPPQFKFCLFLLGTSV